MNTGIGVYIHIPFCKSKCYYCDFNSYSGRDHLAGPYFDALFSEMRAYADTLQGHPVRTIFIGGGTPSLVDPMYISSLLEVCSKYMIVDPKAEISIESNPGTLTYDNLKVYKDAGINRLSIGLQAWQDRHLEKLGRIHRRQQFVENLEAAYKAGFRNINVDLIFGLPEQTFDEWKETLEAVTALGSSKGLCHLSCYSLKIEEGTIFGDRYEAGTLKPADDELDRKMYGYAIEYLTGLGYRHYEISNFAKPGFECRHNLVYWKAEEYAGFGAGAHSYLNRVRYSNAVNIEEYIRSVDGINNVALHKDCEFIDRQEAMSEFMILGLRLIDGISAQEFEDRFGEKLQEVYGTQLRKLIDAGLLETSQDQNNSYQSEVLSRIPEERSAGASAEVSEGASEERSAGASAKGSVNTSEERSVRASAEVSEGACEGVSAGESAEVSGGTSEERSAGASAEVSEGTSERRSAGESVKWSEDSTRETSAEVYKDKLVKTQNLKTKGAERFRLTSRGLDLANRVFMEFIK